MKILIFTILGLLVHSFGIHHPPVTGPRRMVQPPADTVDILFIGDIMAHQAQLDAAEKLGFEGYFTGISEIIEDCDLAVGNLECPIGTEPYSGYPNFSAPFALAEEAAKSGIDILLSANNHICDKGRRGIKSTLAAMDSLNRMYGTLHTGVFRDDSERGPLVCETEGIRIGMINFTYGTNGIPVPEPYAVNLIDTAQIKKDIDAAREAGCDIIIALPHWGDEYVLRHNRRQEKLASWLEANDVDIVVGTHPHVRQDIGEINGMPVVYSLGNYISNMSAANTQLGLAITVRITKRPEHKAKVAISGIHYLWCSRAGHKDDNFTVTVIDPHRLRRDGWRSPYDYDKMMQTYKRLKFNEEHNTLEAR